MRAFVVAARVLFFFRTSSKRIMIISCMLSASIDESLLGDEIIARIRAVHYGKTKHSFRIARKDELALINWYEELNVYYMTGSAVFLDK